MDMAKKFGNNQKIKTITAKDMVQTFREKFNISEENVTTVSYIPDNERSKLERQLARLKTFKREVYDDARELAKFNTLNEKCYGVYAHSGEIVPFDPDFNVNKEIERIEKLLEAIDNDKASKESSKTI